MGLALTVVLILGMPLAALIGPFAFRLVFWVALGLAAAAFLRWGVDLLALVIGALVAACALFHGGRATLRICLDALAEGAKNALPVGIACAIVGIVIGTLTLTGIASTFIGAIIAIGEDNLFLSLVLTMITCLILGMGIPTIPNYIITSSIAGAGAARARRAAARQPHVRLLLRHHGRPDAAGGARRLRRRADGAGSPGMQIALQATKLAVAGYVVPFMAVFTPGADAAGRRRRSPRRSAIRSRSPTSSSRPASASRSSAPPWSGFLIGPMRLWERARRRRRRHPPRPGAAAHRRGRLRRSAAVVVAAALVAAAPRRRA